MLTRRRARRDDADERSPSPGGEDLDVAVRGVGKTFGDFVALDGVDLDIQSGEFVTLLGPSGCGKTTLLRIIAGLETASGGTVEIQGRPMGHVPPYRRPVSLVFQNLSLFPHMNVFKNVAFGPRMAGEESSSIDRRVSEYLALVDLAGYEDRQVTELSGGQQQRVALARALIRQPAVLLLDEPLAALDLKLRRQMQVELKRIQERLGTTFIYVTHDQEEALVMSDRIAVMNAGRVEQFAASQDVYHHPSTAFVASFIGDTNLFEARVTAVDADATHLQAGSIQLIAAATDTGVTAGSNVHVSIRPECISASPVAAASPPRPNEVNGQIIERHFRGATFRAVITTEDDQRLIAEIADDELATELQQGTTVSLSWSPDDTTIVS